MLSLSGVPSIAVGACEGAKSVCKKYGSTFHCKRVHQYLQGIHQGVARMATIKTTMTTNNNTMAIQHTLHSSNTRHVFCNLLRRSFCRITCSRKRAWPPF